MALRITKNKVTTQGVDCNGVYQPLPVCSTRPADTSVAVFTQSKGQKSQRWSFSSLTLDTTDWELLQTGTGQAISQTGGNLVITSGTTANASTVYRLRVGWTDAFIFRYICTLSQRIAQNNFYYMLADNNGDALPCTVNGTTVVVTFPSAHGMEVGQSIEIDCVQNVTGGTIVPGRWAITAADTLTITFTATGSSGTGSGTCSIFGWNALYARYQSTTATNASITSYRKGWGSAETTATINTTASGHMGIMCREDGIISYGDIPVNTTSVTSSRAGRTSGVPDKDATMYVYLICRNGTSNPATTTTWTTGVIQLEQFVAQPVSLHSGRAITGQNLPMVSISGTASVTSGGAAAHDVGVSGNPTRIAGRALTAAYTTVATGDTADLITTLQGVLIMKQYQIPELEWMAADSITNSATAVQCQALTASLHKYVTGFNITYPTLGTAGYFILRSTSMACSSQTISSNTLVTSASTAWKVGDMVYVAASTVTGLTAGNYYYVLTISTTSITFSATRGGGTLAISGTGVTATLHRVIHRHSMPTTALAPNIAQVRFYNPVSGGLALGVEAWTPSATTGQIDFHVWGYTAP